MGHGKARKKGKCFEKKEENGNEEKHGKDAERHRKRRVHADLRRKKRGLTRIISLCFCVKKKSV
jgi:hypothetical protein